MKQCQKCDNLVTDDQVKNCTSIGCLLRIGDEMTRKESAVDVGSPEPSDQFTTLTNIAPGTGDGFSVAPRREPIPSSMAMKFEVLGDPVQLANLSQRVFEILNKDAGVKIREFNYHISG